MRRVKNQSDSLAPLPEHDPVFETLLDEAFGGSAPTDQSEEILERFQVNTAADRPATAPTPRKTSTASSRRPLKLLAWSTLLAAAASFLWIASTFAPNPDVPAEPSIAQSKRRDATDPTGVDAPRPESDQNGAGSPGDGASTSPDALLAGEPGDAGAAKESDGGSPGADGQPRMPMKLRDVPFGRDLAVADERRNLHATPTMPAPPQKQSGQEIVDRINTQLATAWNALSLSRAETAESAEIAERFERTIAVSLSPDEFSDPEQLVQYITTSKARAKIARSLVDELLGPSAASRLHADRRGVLEDRIASAFAGQTGFDEVIASLYLGGENAQTAQASQAWLTALAGSQSVPITEQTARALLDLDLRCSRCHEHPIESGIGQQDYWQFAAIFDNGLYYTRTNDGQTEVRLKETGEQPPEGMFFELPDGRQRVALPAISPEWLGVPGAPSVDQFSDLSAYWIDNPQLAKSTINRLWKIVYGRPLVGSASDPGSPPRDEHLTGLRDYLAEQLRAHDFDLAVATSWMLAAEPMRLKIASSLTGENLLTASTEELLQADYQTRTFAAYRPVERRESFSSLVAMAARWNGGTGIENLPDGPTLAQPVDGGSNRTGPRVDASNPDQYRQQWLRASFPTVSAVTRARPDLPAQWLASLKSFEQQARHLYYAAGYWHPSQSQIEAAELLRASSDDSDLALSQLWWAIENGVE